MWRDSVARRGEWLGARWPGGRCWGPAGVLPVQEPGRGECEECEECMQANIELDRALAAAEGGYHVQLLKLRNPELTTKSDVIVGVPRERAPGTFRWPWPL